VGDRLELRPSKNYINPVVLDALAQSYTDNVENLAVKRAKELFGAEHVNVRPNSALQANMAVYSALLVPGDTVLGVNLRCAGNFKFVEYQVEDQSGRINYENVFGLAFKHKPKLIVAGTDAYPRKIDFRQLLEVAEEVGARLLADISSIAGLVAAGLHPSPVPYADFVTAATAGSLQGPRSGLIMCKGKFAAIIDEAVRKCINDDSLSSSLTAVAAALQEAMSPEFKARQEQTVKNARALAGGLIGYNFNLVTRGTDNNVILADLRSKNVSGQEAEVLLYKAGILVEKHFLSTDSGGASFSGIRLDTSAAAGRGMNEETMENIAGIINLVISHPKDENCLAEAERMVADLCGRYPLGQAKLEVQHEYS